MNTFLPITVKLISTKWSVIFEKSENFWNYLFSLHVDSCYIVPIFTYILLQQFSSILEKVFESLSITVYECILLLDGF